MDWVTLTKTFHYLRFRDHGKKLKRLNVVFA